MCCVVISRAYEIEKRLSTAEMFSFPNFETVCWYVGKHLLDTFRGEAVQLSSKYLCYVYYWQWPVLAVCHLDIINRVLLCLAGLRENRRHPATYLVHGAKALNNAFRTWTRKEVSKI